MFRILGDYTLQQTPWSGDAVAREGKTRWSQKIPNLAPEQCLDTLPAFDLQVVQIFIQILVQVCLAHGFSNVGTSWSSPCLVAHALGKPSF